MIHGWDTCCEIALTRMSLDLTDDTSTLVEVMAWCRKATSHYPSQCWPRSLSPHGVTRPQSVSSRPWQLPWSRASTSPLSLKWSSPPSLMGKMSLFISGPTGIWLFSTTTRVCCIWCAAWVAGTRLWQKISPGNHSMHLALEQKHLCEFLTTACN